MPKYLDSQGVSYLWSKIKNIQKNNLIYQSKTKEEWNSDISKVSEKNVLYIYSDYKIIEKEDGEQVFFPGLKVGDGKTYLVDLPFVNNPNLEQRLLDHINNKIIHVSLADRQFWNNKLNLVDLELHDENLVLNRE